MRRGHAIFGVAMLALAGMAATARPVAAEELARNVQCSNVDPLRLYGPEADFDVLRNHTPIGRHRITFMHRNGQLFVDAHFHIAITFLGMTVYRYDYRSEEVWRGGCLQSVKAKIDDDGDSWTVAAHGQDGALRVSGPAGSYVVHRRVFPTNHWNAEVVRTNAVFNTLTGQINKVKIVRVGKETVSTGDGPRRATHYRITGELKTEVWYDAAGRWVKLRFPGKDGSVIEYVCRRCGPPDATATASEQDG